MFWKRKPKPAPKTLADRIRDLRLEVRRAVSGVTKADASRIALVAVVRELESQAQQVRFRLAQS